MSRPAPPDRAHIVWPRFHRKGEPEPNDPTGHTKNYLLFRRMFAAVCGLCILGGAALYACGTVLPDLFLDQGSIVSIVVAGVFALLLYALSNYDTRAEHIRRMDSSMKFTFMRHVPNSVRVATLILMLGIACLHAYEQVSMHGRFIHIRDGKYALMQKEGRNLVAFVRWLPKEEFLQINAMQLRKIGSGVMFVFLLPTINFWFLREKLD